MSPDVAGKAVGLLLHFQPTSALFGFLLEAAGCWELFIISNRRRDKWSGHTFSMCVMFPLLLHLRVSCSNNLFEYFL